MCWPQPRGLITEVLFTALMRSPGALRACAIEVLSMRDALAGEEVPLALYCLYELHYRGFAGVSDDWEWDATCLELRRRLERASLRELRYEVFLSYGIEKMHAADVLMELSTLTNDTARLRSALTRLTR